MKYLFAIFIALFAVSCAQDFKKKVVINGLRFFTSKKGEIITGTLSFDKCAIKNPLPYGADVWGALEVLARNGRPGHTYKFSCKVSSKTPADKLFISFEPDWLERQYIIPGGDFQFKEFEFKFVPKNYAPTVFLVSETPGEFIVTDLKLVEL